MITTNFIYSAELEMDWCFTAYYPDNYLKNKEYDVVILLHGTNGNNRTLVDRVPLNEIMEKYKDKIVILPNGFNSYYLGKVEKAIINDLLPFLTECINIKTLTLGGVSMGAFGALRLSLKYPDLFENIILISPAIWNPIPPVEASVRKMCAFGKPFDEEKWINNSWFRNVENLNKNNYILIHGLQDEIVDISNCYKFVDYCEENNIHIKKYYIDGNHDSKVVTQGIKKAFKIVF
ncbi:alpha/beta hydrolase-fold protein [Clostridium sp. D53t1_180928_C8]|uniref:alpha/beta hydrolase n=1 Tax=Clostridium sp. D53t1_180928_C8 TaxID=2787101 RepID=UPI0018AA0A8D|nr:alpha/beta hydrolase-fold protein [Clostridium sp. D53t1_180928_C8]